MTKEKETKDIVVGMRPSDYFIDTRKLQFIQENLTTDLTGHSGIKYTNLGKSSEEYAFTSLNIARYLSILVEVAEDLGLHHQMRFVNCITIKVSPYFYITNDAEGALLLVGRYHEESYISPNTLKDLIKEGYDLEFDGTLVFITLEKPKGVKDTILSLKALSEKFPKGFSK